MATKTIKNWNPFGVSLNLTAISGEVKRISATQFTVSITASWATYYSSNRTNYGMDASSGGNSVVINKFGVKANSGSGSFTGTYSISGNAAASKSISVTFKNYNTDNNKSATNSITLEVDVPAWTSYTVSYNANGGSGAPSSQTKWKDQTLTLSSTKPTRTGYSFQGWALTKADADNNKWYYQAGGSCGKNENLTLYAVWKANTYTIKYDANGGKNAPANQTKTYGKTLTITSSIPTRESYNFLGWATSASATTPTYKSGASYTANSSITLYAVWELAYIKPAIRNLVVTRCVDSGNSVYVDDETGEYARFRFDWESAYGDVNITYKLNGSLVYQTDMTGLSGSVDMILTSSGEPLQVDPEHTCDISVVITDSKSSYTATYTLASIRPTIDGKAGGNGVAFGKIATEEGFADFGYEVCMNNQLRISGRAPDGTIIEAFQPINENGNTVVGWGNYSRGAGNTNVYGNVVNVISKEHVKITGSGNTNLYGNAVNVISKENVNISGADIVLSPNNAGDDVRPYRRKGDSLSFTVRTSGYVTNSGQDVHFIVPFAVPIIGNPTVTVTSGTGMLLRQGNKYTHGCSADNRIFPVEYTATVSAYMGVRIVASFTDTTNVTNNDSIGIDWNGTITFT